jgi:esterase/lipase superfamily enzyme
LLPVAQASAAGTPRVPVLVATTRKPSTADAGEMFGGERARTLSYASVTVSIPPDTARKIGEVQWPSSLPGDPSRDFVTVSANYLDRGSFTAAITKAAKQTRRSKVLVFVHGFNNRFDEAVYRLAQISYDSQAPGIPVLFSWPSQGVVGLQAYENDRESALDSRASFQQLLDTIANNPKVKEVTVLCHSMGCLLTLEALHAKATRTGRIGDKVKNVLLVAPDVDFNRFRAQMAQMGSARPRFALFVSQDDRALKISSAIQGGTTRLGAVNPEDEPYRSEFKRERIIAFDLTHLKGDSHSRAFDDVTSVVAMIERRLFQGQQMTDVDPGGRRSMRARGSEPRR